MRILASCARAGNRMLDIVATCMVAVMLLYGSYSLWDNYRINHQAFLSDELLQYKPTPEDTESLAELMALNPDVVGWITIDGTHIDYPLLQGKDDMEYVNLDVHKEFALSGSIFLSCMNSRDMTDNYSLIYGHHMENGGMFGDVLEFLDKEYFDKHLTGTIYLLGSTIPIDIFACVKTDAADNMVYNISQQEEDVSTLLEYIEETAVQYRDLGLNAQEKLVGLSTCEEAITNGRVIVYGRLGEPVKTDNGDVTKGQTE